MDLNVRQSGNICTLKLKGRMTSGDPVNEFESAFHSALDSGHLCLILDLEEVPYIDSSGIGSIVNALRTSTSMGGSAKLLKPSPFITKMFTMVAILGLFGVYETEADAVAACGS